MLIDKSKLLICYVILPRNPLSTGVSKIMSHLSGRCGGTVFPLYRFQHSCIVYASSLSLRRCLSNAAISLLPQPHIPGQVGTIRGLSRFSLVKVSDVPASRGSILL